MGSEVVVGAVREGRDFSPAERKLVFEVARSLGVVWESFFRDFDEADFFGLEAECFCEKSCFFFEPRLKMLRISSGFAEVFDFYLFEFTRSEDEVFGCDFVAECFPRLCDTEWELLAR